MTQQKNIKTKLVTTVLLTIPALAFSQLPPTQWEVPQTPPNTVSESVPRKITTMKPITIRAPKIKEPLSTPEKSMVSTNNPTLKSVPLPTPKVVATQVPVVIPTPTIPVTTPVAAQKAPEPVKVAVEIQVARAPIRNTTLIPVYQPQPDVPREMRTVPVVGTVTVGFTVEIDGTVSNTAIVNTTNRKLNNTTLDAVAKWKFEPIFSKQNTNVEIQFNIE